jgi:hypothetical protein
LYGCIHVCLCVKVRCDSLTPTKSEANLADRATQARLVENSTWSRQQKHHKHIKAAQIMPNNWAEYRQIWRFNLCHLRSEKSVRLTIRAGSLAIATLAAAAATRAEINCMLKVGSWGVQHRRSKSAFRTRKPIA